MAYLAAFLDSTASVRFTIFSFGLDSPIYRIKAFNLCHAFDITIKVEKRTRYSPRFAGGDIPASVFEAFLPLRGHSSALIPRAPVTEQGFPRFAPASAPMSGRYLENCIFCLFGSGGSGLLTGGTHMPKW